MSVISEKVNSLLTVYNTASATMATDRQARSEMLHVIGGLYTQRTQKNPTLDKKYFQNGLSDGYLVKAEDVVYRDSFSRFPGSYGRLKPLAQEYIFEWSHFLATLSHCSTSPMDERTLNARVQSFVSAHLTFSRQYLAEYTTHAADTHNSVELKFPRTLKVFYSFTSTFIAKNPSLGAPLKEIIEFSDEKIFLIVPYLVVLKWIQCTNGSCPELLKPLEEKIAALRTCYNQLDLNEKNSLEAGLLDENRIFSAKEDAVKVVHLQLKEIAYSLQSKENAQPFARCFKILLTDLNEDFSMAEKLRPHLESALYSNDVIPGTAGAIYALLHLPFESVALFFPFLPTLKQIESFHEKFSKGSSEFRIEVKNYLTYGLRINSDPDFMKIADVQHDLRHEGEVYRLLGILQHVFPDMIKSQEGSPLKIL